MDEQLCIALLTQLRANTALALMIAELRDAFRVLEARVADLEAQHLQDRQRFYTLQNYLQEAQRRANAAAAREPTP